MKKKENSKACSSCWEYHPIRFGFVPYRGPGSLRSRCVAGEGLDRGGSDTEQVCLTRIITISFSHCSVRLVTQHRM